MADPVNKKNQRQHARKAGYYAAQVYVTIKNKARKLRHHIRSNPGDLQAQRRYEVDMGSVAGVLSNLNSKGRKLLRQQARAAPGAG